MYASQCRKVRELLESGEVKDGRLSQLEADVVSLSDRLEKASAEARRSEEDMISLRHEMQWKDDRIRYLETLVETNSKTHKLIRQQTSSPESVINEESL